MCYGSKVISEKGLSFWMMSTVRQAVRVRVRTGLVVLGLGLGLSLAGASNSQLPASKMFESDIVAHALK